MAIEIKNKFSTEPEKLSTNQLADSIRTLRAKIRLLESLEKSYSAEMQIRCEKALAKDKATAILTTGGPVYYTDVEQLRFDRSKMEEIFGIGAYDQCKTKKVYKRLYL